MCNTPVGTVKIVSEGSNVYSLEFVYAVVKDEIPVWLDNYFKNKEIDINCIQTGTHFQQQVWEEIAKIPWGQTRTYSDIAMSLGKPKAYRAVANACGKNKICLLVPCHRVVSKHGIGGYSSGVDIKKRLLTLEQKL